MEDLLNLLSKLELPETYPSLMAILGLALIWKFHDMQVKAGRIKAKDFWARSGIRMFIHATPDDSAACPACQEADGLVFHPDVVASKKFKAMEKPCANPAGCRCLMVGLYGAWAQAGEVRAALKENSGRTQLSDDDMRELLDGAKGWGGQATGPAVDRVSLRMLHAMRDEGSNPQSAMEGYRYVIDRAEEDRDLPFIVPSFLRLSDLLERAGRAQEALDMVERCLTDYGGKKKGPDAPTEAQRTQLTKRKAHLLSRLKK